MVVVVADVAAAAAAAVAVVVVGVVVVVVVCVFVVVVVVVVLLWLYMLQVARLVLSYFGARQLAADCLTQCWHASCSGALRCRCSIAGHTPCKRGCKCQAEECVRCLQVMIYVNPYSELE